MTPEQNERYRREAEVIAKQMGIELRPLLASAESIDRSVTGLNESMGRMLACSEQYLPEIADSTRRAADGIAVLVTLAESPSATAASEMRRRGAHALSLKGG